MTLTPATLVTTTPTTTTAMKPSMTNTTTATGTRATITMKKRTTPCYNTDTLTMMMELLTTATTTPMATEEPPIRISTSNLEHIRQGVDSTCTFNPFSSATHMLPHDLTSTNNSTTSFPIANYTQPTQAFNPHIIVTDHSLNRLQQPATHVSRQIRAATDSSQRDAARRTTPPTRPESFHRQRNQPPQHFQVHRPHKQPPLPAVV